VFLLVEGLEPRIDLSRFEMMLIARSGRVFAMLSSW